MGCRTIEKEDLAQAKALWKQAFEDSNAYIDYQFEHNLDLRYSLGIFDKDKLTCMLYMIPKTLVCCDGDINTFFIIGVATDKAYRYQGLARRIMEEARKFLFKQHVPMVFLYPFNHDFYKKLGYHTISWMRKVTLKKPAEPILSAYRVLTYDKEEKPDYTLLYTLYDAFALTKKAYFKRTPEDFEKMLNTMYVDGGKAAIVYKNNLPMGYVLYFIEQGKLHCTETVFLTLESARETAKILGNLHKGFLYIDDSYPLEDSMTEQYAMMQIVDLNAAKSYYVAQDAHEVLDTETMILEQY